MRAPAPSVAPSTAGWGWGLRGAVPDGTIPLGVGLMFAVLLGALLVLTAGAARVPQLCRVAPDKHQADRRLRLAVEAGQLSQDEYRRRYQRVYQAVTPRDLWKASGGRNGYAGRPWGPGRQLCGSNARETGGFAGASRRRNP